MSGKLLALKKSIKATKTTKKMTKAMELVASSKMKQFQNKAANSLYYTNKITQIVTQGLRDDYYNDNIFVTKRDYSVSLVILYTSDKGLCGSMNTRIFKTLQKSSIYSQDNIYIVIGKKGKKFAKNNNLNVVAYFSDMSDSTSELEIIEIVDSVIKNYKEKSVGSVYMVTPNFKSTLIFYPRVFKFLPIHLDDLDTPETKEDLYKMEPNKLVVYEKALENYIVSKFYSAFLDLKAVEYSTRMIAMKNATTAADERIDQLTLFFNKARQSAITQEITEIVNGTLE